ncbi:MAG: EMC3/TMCO1 family protein [Candidatus Aenigmatarchaeota archaeon]
MFDGLNAALGVAIVAGLLLAIINAFYRLFVNQERAAEIKARVQELNAEVRKVPQERQKELLSQAMAQQRELMRMNIKPMMLSFIAVAILLPWLGAYYHDVEVTLTDGAGSFELSADGSYAISVSEGAASIEGNGERVNCQLPCDVILAKNIWKISTGSDGKARLSLVAAVLPPLPLIGGWQLGWIWWYVIVSVPLAIVIRAAYGIRS